VSKRYNVHLKAVIIQHSDAGPDPNLVQGSICCAELNAVWFRQDFPRGPEWDGDPSFEASIRVSLTRSFPRADGEDELDQRIGEHHC